MTWITTYTGREFHFDNPYAHDFSIEDIAHALSNICRFTGHTKEFYSVAQHSVAVSYLVPPELALAGLLHDGSETYLTDIASPLKAILPQYKDLEVQVEVALLEAFNLPWPLPKCIKEADLVMLATEQRDLMGGSGDTWTILKGVTPLHNPINPLPPKEAEKLFLSRYQELINVQSTT